MYIIIKGESYEINSTYNCLIIPNIRENIIFMKCHISFNIINVLNVCSTRIINIPESLLET